MFLTIVGRGGPPTSHALGWFPVVGAMIGCVIGLAWWGASQVWPPLVAAVVVVGLDLVVTGALHHDGLADSADGLLPHLNEERRLAVMHTPDVGAFGLVAVVTTILLRAAALGALTPAPLLIGGIWCASRTAMAVTARSVPYARPSGLATPFLGGAPIVPLIVGTTISLALVAWSGWPAVAALLALVLASAAVSELARRRLGGFTGDVLGAIGVVGETTALVVLAAKW